MLEQKGFCIVPYGGISVYLNPQLVFTKFNYMWGKESSGFYIYTHVCLHIRP